MRITYTHTDTDTESSRIFFLFICTICQSFRDDYFIFIFIIKKILFFCSKNLKKKSIITHPHMDCIWSRASFYLQSICIICLGWMCMVCMVKIWFSQTFVCWPSAFFVVVLFCWLARGNRIFFIIIMDRFRSDQTVCLTDDDDDDDSIARSTYL